MNKHQKQHLENITVERLEEFQSDAFIPMASCSSVRGTVNIGVNALGQFVVKRKNENWRFDNPNEAIEKYTELVTITD